MLHSVFTHHDFYSHALERTNAQTFTMHSHPLLSTLEASCRLLFCHRTSTRHRTNQPSTVFPIRRRHVIGAVLSFYVYYCMYIYMYTIKLMEHCRRNMHSFVRCDFSNIRRQNDAPASAAYAYNINTRRIICRRRPSHHSPALRPCTAPGRCSSCAYGRATVADANRCRCRRRRRPTSASYCSTTTSPDRLLSAAASSVRRRRCHCSRTRC